MKKIYSLVAMLPILAFGAVSCSEFEEDASKMDYKQTRVSLYPRPETFNADGTTADGKASYIAAVTVNKGTTRSNAAWEAALKDKQTWAYVVPAAVPTSFKETFKGDIYEGEEKGIEIKLQPNKDWKRTFTVEFTVSDGTVVPFTFTQLGEKPDAEVTSDVTQVEIGFAGGETELLYNTNMGDVYKYVVTYPGDATGWLTVTGTEAGKAILSAPAWDNTENGREAELTIIVGTVETSTDSLTIPVYQVARDKYYYMYGESADKTEAADGKQMEKISTGFYKITCYFNASSDGKNPVLFSIDSRNSNYPLYALASDGTIKEVKDDSGMPQGPEIAIDGLRNLTINLNDMKWEWDRITTTNCLPDEEVANYKTKSYIARDGSMKTWMIEDFRWDGGNIVPKLGSPMVPAATGNGKDGTGGYTAGSAATGYIFPFTSYADVANLNMKFETTEIGGELVGTNEHGRIYSFNEIITGEPRAGLGFYRYEAIPESWHVGKTLVDAVGNSMEVEIVNFNKPAEMFTGDNAKDEQTHPMLKVQAQGICPYGWHVANAADWLDLAYAASQASATTFKVDESQVTYRRLIMKGTPDKGDTPKAKVGIGNFGAWLKNNTWWDGTKCSISDGSDDFGFNAYPLGYRYMTQGFQNAGERVYWFVPLVGPSSKADAPNAAIYRTQVLINTNHNSNTHCTALNMINIDNGQAIFPFRCVKNYK